jgi:hypothetical protein
VVHAVEKRAFGVLVVVVVAWCDPVLCIGLDADRRPERLLVGTPLSEFEGHVARVVTTE